MAFISALLMNPRVVVIFGCVIVAQIAGTRFSVQMMMATAITASVAAKTPERKTSHAYQRSTSGWSAGTPSAIHWGALLPRSVPMRTSSVRKGSAQMRLAQGIGARSITLIHRGLKRVVTIEQRGSIIVGEETAADY